MLTVGSFYKKVRSSESVVPNYNNYAMANAQIVFFFSCINDTYMCGWCRYLLWILMTWMKAWKELTHPR